MNKINKIEKINNNNKLLQKLSTSKISSWYRRKKLAQALEVYQNFVFKNDIDLAKYFHVEEHIWDHIGLLDDIKIIKKRRGFLDDLIESSDDESNDDESNDDESYQYMALPTLDETTPLLESSHESEDIFDQDFSMTRDYTHGGNNDNSKSLFQYILSFFF
jgi:hypothetical protein